MLSPIGIFVNEKTLVGPWAGDWELVAEFRNLGPERVKGVAPAWSALFWERVMVADSAGADTALSPTREIAGSGNRS